MGEGRSKGKHVEDVDGDSGRGRFNVVGCTNFVAAFMCARVANVCVCMCVQRFVKRLHLFARV